MATIDKLDLGVYIQYARRTQYVEEFSRQIHLEESSTIPPQTSVTDLSPKLLELDLLLGVARSYAPWAYFFPPKLFTFARKSPFTKSKISPSIASEEEEDEEILDAIQTHSPKENEEKEVLKKCLKQLRTINEWLGYIIGRVGQLLQG
ncbi:MAG: hypothetical protein K940chlam3_00235 [Chlamydiae bacterium]|nr:hypothetical protein [Chlamydiota bacterium]